MLPSDTGEISWSKNYNIECLRMTDWCGVKYKTNMETESFTRYLEPLE